MINASTQYFNGTAFEKMGVAVKAQAQAKKVNTSNLSYYLEDELGFTDPGIYYFSTEDDDGVTISLEAQKIHDILAEDYNVSTQFTRTFNYTHTMSPSAVTTNLCPGVTPETGISIYRSVYGHVNPEVVSIDINTHAYELVPTEWYSIKDTVVDENGDITVVKLDSNWVETGEEFQKFIGFDDRVIYLTRFAQLNTCGDPSRSTTWTDVPGFSLFYKQDIILDITDYNFLMFPIKDNYNMVEQGSYRKVMLNSFGLGNGELDGSMSDGKIKAAMLAYSTFDGDVGFQKSMQAVYGGQIDNNYNDVTFVNSHHRIQYLGSNPMGGGGGYKIIFEGSGFKVGDKLLLMVPTDAFYDMAFIDRYKFLSRTFCLWSNSQETIKTKWYQTGLFKIIITAVAAIGAVITQQYWIIGVVLAAPYVIEFVTDKFGAFAGAALAVALSVATLSPQAAASTMFATAANVVNTISSAFFTVKSEKLAEEQADIYEDIAEAEEWIEENKKQALYIPFDGYDSYFDLMNEAQYEIYNSAYNVNYDKMFLTNGGEIV